MDPQDELRPVRHLASELVVLNKTWSSILQEWIDSIGMTVPPEFLIQDFFNVQGLNFV